MEQSAAKKQLALDMKKQLQNCIGFQGDELASVREDAYNYYFQRPRNDEVPGRSSVVTGDVSSMVEGNLAQMIGPLSSRRIAEYCAYDEADEEQAQLESDCVNELIFKKQNGFIELVSAIKDAMLLRNAVVKVWIDQRTFKRSIRKENVDPAITEELLRKVEQQQSVRGVETKVDVHTYDVANKKISFTVTKNSKKFRVEALAPENFLLPKTWHRQDLENVPFCAERHVEPRSALIERQFNAELVAKLPKFARPAAGAVNARLPNNISQSTQAVDSAADEIEWYECYCLLDDGTGTSELRCISICGDYILDDSDANLVSYATGAIIINPHTWFAISLYDKLKSTQDSGTALTRALHDNLNTTNKNRTAHFEGIAEEIDVTDGRTNGSIRVKPGMGISDVRQAVTAFAIPDTSANILMNLENNRKVRSEMGGAALDMATGQMQLNDRVGSLGLDRAYSVQEMFASLMTKIIAQTLIRSMFLIAHETLRTEWNGPIAFKRGNKWINQNPSTWQARESVQVNLGESQGERMRLSAVYEKMMAKQEALAGLGMEDILVDATGYHKATLAWLRINDVPNPEQFFLDPRSDKSVENFKKRGLQRLMQQQKQDALMQQALGLEQVRTALTKYQGDAELQFKYWDSVLKAQIEEAKLTLQGVTDALKAKTTAEAARKNDESGTEEGSSTSTARESTTASAASRVSE